MLDPPSGVGITFQVMTVSRQSTGDEDPVDTFLKGAQQDQLLNPSGAGHQNHLDRGRILQTQTAGEVRRGIGTVFTAVGRDLNSVCFHP